MNDELWLAHMVLKTSTATVAAMALMLNLRAYDWLAGSRFRTDVKERMGEVYYGYRFLGLSLLFGMVFAFT